MRVPSLIIVQNIAYHIRWASNGMNHTLTVVLFDSTPHESYNGITEDVVDYTNIFHCLLSDNQQLTIDNKNMFQNSRVNKLCYTSHMARTAVVQLIQSSSWCVIASWMNARWKLFTHTAQNKHIEYSHFRTPSFHMFIKSRCHSLPKQQALGKIEVNGPCITLLIT